MQADKRSRPQFLDCCKDRLKIFLLLQLVILLIVGMVFGILLLAEKEDSARRNILTLLTAIMPYVILAFAPLIFEGIWKDRKFHIYMVYQATRRAFIVHSVVTRLAFCLVSAAEVWGIIALLRPHMLGAGSDAEDTAMVNLLFNVSIPAFLTYALALLSIATVSSLLADLRITNQKAFGYVTLSFALLYFAVLFSKGSFLGDFLQFSVVGVFQLPPIMGLFLAFGIAAVTLAADVLWTRRLSVSA